MYSNRLHASVSKCDGDASSRPFCWKSTGAALLLPMMFFAGETCAAAAAPHWVGSWMAAPCSASDAEPRHDQFELHAETVREIVHLSSGGVAVRLRLSNVFGTSPLTLRSIHIAKRTQADGIDPATDMVATVSHSPDVTIPAGASVFTDPVNLPVDASTDIAVSFFVPARITAPAIHYTALETSYLAAGDQSSKPTLSSPTSTTLRVILTGVDVATRTSPGAIVAIGSSTTDGAHSHPNLNHRWTDDLFARLYQKSGGDAASVLNAGISGNRVLHDGRGEWGPVWGEAAVIRFHRDVLEQSSARYVILFEGGNDIRQPGSGAVPMEDTVSAQQLIAGFEVMAHEAHQRGLKVIVGTITPFEHADLHRTEDPAWEQTRAAFNAWVRSTKSIDGIVDFDAAVRDPTHPARLLPAFDSGDHLHPNDAGYKAMADGIDLSLFSPANQPVSTDPSQPTQE